MIYEYFPRLKDRRHAMAGYTSGGEQQMCAIGRAMMSRPKMILLDEPSMGLAPQIVEEIFGIVQSLNEKEGVSFLLAEQNTFMALQIRPLRLHSGKWPRGDGRRREVADRERGREGILSRHRRRQAQIVPRGQALQAAQSAGWRDRPCPAYLRTLLICAAIVAGSIVLLVLDDMRTNSQVHTITTSSLVFLGAIMGAVTVAIVASIVKFVRG